MKCVRVGDVLRLDIERVKVDSTETYTTAGVRSFGRGLFLREPVVGSESSYKSLNRLKRDQIVMSRLFGWEGAVAIVPREFDGVFVSPEFPTFSIDDERAVPAYVGHFVRWPTFHEQLAAQTRGLGQRRKRVHAEQLLACEIPLPPVDVQREVADRLDAMDKATTTLADLARRAQGLGDALSVSLATRPDLDDAAKRRAGWRLLPLGDLLTAKESSAVDVEPGDKYPIAGVYSFGRGLIDRGVISGSETSYKTLRRLEADDIVFSKLNAWEGAVTIVPQDFEGFFVSSEFPTFGFDHREADPVFLNCLVRSPEFWSRMNDVTQGSMVRRRRINASQFLGIEIWLPPIEEQLAATGLISRLSATSASRQDAVDQLSALLPAAMNEVFARLS